MISYTFSTSPKPNFGDHSAAILFLNKSTIEEQFESYKSFLNIKLSKIDIDNLLSESASTIITQGETTPNQIIIVAYDTKKKFSTDFFRAKLYDLMSDFKENSIHSLHIFIPEDKNVASLFSDLRYYYLSFFDGVSLGFYDYDKYKKEKKKKTNIDLFFYAENQVLLSELLQEYDAINAGVLYTRELQNVPAKDLTPEIFAENVKTTFSELPVKITVFNVDELKKRNMNGHIGVGEGSTHPPNMIITEYEPDTKAEIHVVLVGKGITFDSGGISLKPATDMWLMKSDMAGAAVVAGTMKAISKNKLPIKVTGIICAAENMPSGSAFRPGDILTMANGKSVEVDNTDAEGRLVLADGLHYASNLKPDLIVDLATLTGSCVVALGEFVSGIFTKDEILGEALYRASQDTHELAWRMPMWDDYKELIKSDVADVINTGPRWGGAITAAKFLEHFVDENIPWAHMDIAGPAIPNSGKNYYKKYMTGYGVRLLYTFLKQYKKH